MYPCNAYEYLPKHYKYYLLPLVTNKVKKNGLSWLEVRLNLKHTDEINITKVRHVKSLVYVTRVYFRFYFIRWLNIGNMEETREGERDSLQNSWRKRWSNKHSVMFVDWSWSRITTMKFKKIFVYKSVAIFYKYHFRIKNYWLQQWIKSVLTNLFSVSEIKV